MLLHTFGGERASQLLPLHSRRAALTRLSCIKNIISKQKKHRDLLTCLSFCLFSSFLSDFRPFHHPLWSFWPVCCRQPMTWHVCVQMKQLKQGVMAGDEDHCASLISRPEWWAFLGQWVWHVIDESKVLVFCFPTRQATHPY